MTLPMVPPALLGSQGANILFLTNDAIPYSPPTRRGSWDKAGASFTKKMAIIPSGSSSSFSRNEENEDVASVHNDFMGKFGSGPLLQNVTIQGTLDGVIGTLCDSAGDSVRIHMFVTIGATDVVRGTLLSTVNFGSFRNPTAAGRYISTSISSVNALAGDHIIFEMGVGFTNGALDSTATYYFGVNSPDLLTDGDTNVTTKVGYFRFVNVALPLAS